MATIHKRGTRWQVQVSWLDNRSGSKSVVNRKDAEAWARQTEIQLDRRELPHNPGQLERFTDLTCFF